MGVHIRPVKLLNRAGNPQVKRPTARQAQSVIDRFSNQGVTEATRFCLSQETGFEGLLESFSEDLIVETGDRGQDGQIEGSGSERGRGLQQQVRVRTEIGEATTDDLLDAFWDAPFADGCLRLSEIMAL